MTPTNGWGSSHLIGIHELAAYLGVPISTVCDWQVHGKVPTGHRFGKHLKFAVSDAGAWVVEQREPSSL